MSRSGWEALVDVRERLGGHPECPSVVGRPLRMSRSDRKALPGSRDSSQCLGVVRRPSRMSGSGREALSDEKEWSGGPPGCLGVIERPSRLSESSREALPDVR